MREAKLTKYFLVKYFVLILGLLQLLIALLLGLQQGGETRGQLSALLFLALGISFVVLFLTVTSRVQRVAISRKNVAIITRGRAKRYNLSAVKYIRAIPAFGICCMKLKGRKRRIYFIPHRPQQPLSTLRKQVSLA